MEKSFLVEESVINGDLISDENSEIKGTVEESVLEEIPNGLGITYRVKDSFHQIVSKNFRNKKPVDAIKRHKLVKRQNFFMDLRNFFKKMFTVNTYVLFVQKFEPLLTVLFIDVLYISILFSTLYILYIIININSENFDLFPILFKIIGAVLVVLLNYLVLNNAGVDTKNMENDL